MQLDFSSKGKCGEITRLHDSSLKITLTITCVSGLGQFSFLQCIDDECFHVSVCEEC